MNLGLGLLLALAGGASRELPVYPGAIHTRIGTDVVLDGEVFQVAYFTTPDPLLKVAEYFFNEWKRIGYPTTVDGDLSKEGVISAFCTREGVQRSVILRMHQGKTLGFSVLRDLRIRMGREFSRQSPTLERTLLVHDLTFLELGPASHQTALVAAKFATVRERVLQRLESAGRRLIAESLSKQSDKRRIRLEHGQNDDRATTILIELEPELTAVVEVQEASAGAGRLKRAELSAGESTAGDR